MHANIHLNAISRSKGRHAVASTAYRSGSKVTAQSMGGEKSAVAAAAYRAGENLHDQKEGKSFDYTQKGDNHVTHSGMLTPDNAPDWAKDRESYWNAVEAREKRKDALLAKEAVLVLPRNLSTDQQKEVVEGWAKDNLVEKRGLVADYAIHNPDASDGGKNPHAHIMYYPRPFDEKGDWSHYKLTGYKTENTVDGVAVLKGFRQSYQDHLNEQTPANENGQKVFDLRSYKDRGIDKTPQPKIGAKVKYMSQRGFVMEHGKKVEKVRAMNAAQAGRRKHVQTFKQIGTGTGKHSGLTESAREDVAKSYYDVMYGDGSAGSYEKQQEENER